jgi:hypothetical protein
MNYTTHTWTNGSGTPISAANLTAIESGISSVDTSVLIRGAKAPDLIISGSIVRNSSNAVTSAAVTWEDGVSGVYTALVLSSAFPGAVDSYSVTYVGSSTKTFTQPTITRDANGNATTIPAIVIT